MGDGSYLLHDRGMWRLWFAIDEILRLRRLAPKQMRRVVGHLADHLSVRRETLATLQEVYRFIGDGSGGLRPLPAPLVQELRVIQGVLPMCVQALGKPILPRVYCSDASDFGYAVHVPESRPSDALLAARFRERWRFRERPPDAAAAGRDDVVGTSADYFDHSGLDRDFSDWAEELMAREEANMPAARPSPPAAHRAVEVWTGGVPSLDEHWTRPERWPRLIAGAWKSSGTIHCKEARAALVGLRRECSDHRSHGHLLLAFGDNLAEVLAFDRGRARDFELQSLVRRACAWQLAADVKWARRYVETSRNPSDWDSRLANRGVLRPGAIFRGPRPSRETPLAAAVPGRWIVDVAESSRASSSYESRRPDRPPARRAPAAPAPAPMPNLPPGRLLWEASGTAPTVTPAAMLHSLRVAPALRFDDAEDTGGRGGARQALQHIRTGKFWAVHLGASGLQWPSPGRRACHGSHRVRGRRAAEQFLSVLRACRLSRCLFSVGAAASSPCWSWPPLQRELERAGGDTVDVACAEGPPSGRRRFRLVSNMPGVCGLRLRPPPQPGERCPAAARDAMPPAVAAAVGCLLAAAAPRDAWCRAAGHRDAGQPPGLATRTAAPAGRGMEAPDVLQPVSASHRESRVPCGSGAAPRR